MKPQGQWIKLIAVVCVLGIVSGCVVRPLGWGHRHGGNHYEKPDRDTSQRNAAPSWPRDRR